MMRVGINQQDPRRLKVDNQQVPHNSTTQQKPWNAIRKEQC
jgi:hypothetical protein